MHALVVDLEAFSAKQDGNTSIAVANASSRNLFYALAQDQVQRPGERLAVIRRSIEFDRIACASNTYPKGAHEKADTVALLRRLHSFFETIS